MALFGNKEQNFLSKYGLNNISKRNRKAVNSIAAELSGTGMMEAGMKLTLGAKPKDTLPVMYLRTIMEQNWVMIKELDEIVQALNKMSNTEDVEEE